MLLIRTWHTYLGILIAPSVLFFSLTGSYQLFGLHEPHGTYIPSPLLEKLSMLHKDQVFGEKEHQEDKRPDGGTASAEHERPGPPGDHEDKSSPGTLLLKWYFLIVALSLTATTILGLYMGLTHLRRKRTGWWLLGVGIAIPVALSMI